MGNLQDLTPPLCGHSLNLFGPQASQPKSPNWQKYRVSLWKIRDAGLEAAAQSPENGAVQRHFRRSSDPAHFSVIHLSAPSSWI